MSNMDNISEQLFAKIRGRFPSVTLGDEQGVVTDEPKLARYFDFDYKVGEDSLGKVSISLTEKEIAIMYNNTFISEQPDSIKKEWYDFLKEIRVFSKRNMLNFDTRDITKSNLDKRDYAHLTKTAGEKTMSESKMYGTSRTSYEDVDKARLVLKHTQPVNMEVPGARTQHVHSIYIESENGERFKYPFRHLNGARALARHVSEGGNLYDDFGKHIVSLSEELSKLRQFKTYMNRSAVMAEGLKGYMDLVNERLDTIKTEVLKLQRAGHYAETIKDFKPSVMEEVPEELQNSWIDELTIRTFNEELKNVFPYINRLVSEKNKIQEMGPLDFLGEEKTEELKSWYEKYKQYKSADADNLADGMFKFHLDSGVDLDTVEKSEYEALVKKHGEDKVSGNALKYIDEMPITNSMLDDFQKIMGSVDEETVEKASDMLNNTNEVSDMGMNKYGLSAVHKGGKFYSFKNGKQTGGPFDSMEELAKHQEELIKDEAMGHEGGSEAHAHRIYIDGDYDEDRGISEKDCEEMEYACGKAGIKCKCEPDEMRQGGVVIHTMAPRDAVIDALDKEGYNVEEAIIEPADDFADRINSINPKHDEAGQDASEGNEFAQKVRELKAKGAKPGTKFKTSDGEEHTLEQAITKVGLNVEDFFTAEELANENPMTQADLDAERFSDMHDFENFKDAVMSEIEDGKNGKGQYAGKDKKEIIAMLRKEADSIGYADVSDGERHPSEPTWLKAVADELEKSKTADQTEEEDPKTDFTKWLMKNYNKSPRDLKGDEYVKMSKMFQASKKKEDAETEEPEIELEEFIKSLYDYTSNTFPKGETAVLTAVEKKYGESSMRPAAEMMKELVSGQDQEMERIKKLAGV